jgi:NAD(P)-dependent dehydrogenase (short-subunit alcohol dehydrogenase family)
VEDISANFMLTGKTALVTGASSGIGVAIARAFASAGAAVVLGARRTERLETLRREIEAEGGTAASHFCDVSDPQSCQALVDYAVATLGGVDVLVNNAGTGSAHPASRETPDEFREVIDVNLNGCYWMAQACGRVMKPGSSIINISSVLALSTGGLPQAAYSASKAGLLGLTRDLACQWTGRKGIRVNALLPGFFPSELVDLYSPEYLEDLVARRVLMGRCGRLEEICTPALFLASDASSYVTGAALPVDGGFLLT